MVFENKKLSIDTLGEYLSDIRSQSGLSIKEVSNQTGIAEKFLQELETGQFHKLPPDVYVIGFLKKLAALYAIPITQLIAQYKKERGILEQFSRRQKLQAKGWRGYVSRLIITPKLLSLAIGLVAVLATVIYLTASVAAIDRNPTLEIFEPSNGSIAKDGAIKVSGKTDPGTTVVINDQEVFVDSEGKFNVTLGAVDGQKVLDIKAKNKFDRETRQQILVVAETGVPSSEIAAPNSVQQNDNLILQLSYSQPTTRTVIIDNGTPQKQLMTKNSTEQFQANSSIVLDVDDAGSVSATFNGQALGVLGRSKEQLSIPFSKDSVVNEKAK